MTLTWAQALAWRSARQFLREPATSPAAVVDRLNSVPATVGDPELAVGVRLDPNVASGIAAAVDDGRLICTFTFRGAVHVGSHEQMARFLSMRRAGRQWERRSWREHYGLEPGDWPRLLDVVQGVLADGPLTFDDLAQAVGRTPQFAHVQQRFSYTLLKAMAWHGAVCFDSLSDRRLLRGLADDPRWAGLPDLDDAGRAAIVEYLGSFGPAGADQLEHRFVRGLSVGRRRLDAWLGDLGDQVTTVTIDGDPAYCLTEHVDELAATAPSTAVTLLPGNDQWVVAAGSADPHLVPPAHRVVATRGKPLVLRGGRVSGTWRLGRDVLAIEWFGDGAAPRDELESAAGVVLARTDARAEVRVSSVD